MSHSASDESTKRYLSYRRDIDEGFDAKALEAAITPNTRCVKLEWWCRECRRIPLRTDGTGCGSLLDSCSVTARPIKRTAKWLVTKMPLLAPEFD
jgi:hypothetical protein